MPRKIQSTYTKSKSYNNIVCIGDSHTYNKTLGVLPDEFYTAKLSALMNANNCNVMGYNNGVSGNTTGQMLARVSLTIQFGIPKLAVVYGGTNDAQYNTTVQASPSPTSTVVTVGLGNGASYIKGTYCKVGNESALILSVSNDAITLSEPLAGGAPTAGTAVVIDTQTNLKKIGDYLVSHGCSRIVYGGQHYLNFSSGGDTHASPVAINATLRGLQQSAAASVIGAVYCDFWSYMDNLIQTNVVTQGSYSWHVMNSDTHLNAYGEQILAEALYATISTQTGWVSDLS